MNFKFSTQIAIKHSVIESIFLDFLNTKIKKCKNSIDFKNGLFWYTASIESINKQIPFLTNKKIRGVLDKLYNKKIIDKFQFNKEFGNRTYSYTIIDDEIKNILNIQENK